MITHIHGKVIWNNDRYLVVETGGLGYKIFGTTELCLSSSKNSNKEIELWLHEVIREDANDLYGFREKADLDFFELLISISGIGPKSALGIMNVSPVSVIQRAVAEGDTSHLTKVSGIGKKLAEKIVLELKDKIINVNYENTGSLKSEIEVLEALKAIGYDHNDAREALKQIPANITETKERIRHALKILGK